MSYSITKDHTFAASHQLEGLQPGHKCGRVHGHNYTVRVEVEGPLDHVGFVMDYGDLAPLWAWVDTVLDHRHLNDAMDENPTAENVAWLLHGVATKVLALPAGAVLAVGVSETPRTWAWYRP